MSRWSIDLAILALLFLSAAPLAAATDPITGSSVRIIEGNTAPGWELRFLPPPPPAVITQPDAPLVPDADAAIPAPTVKRSAPSPLNRTATPRRAEREIDRTERATSPEKAEPPVANVTERPLRKPTAPTAPATPPPLLPTSKIDKEEETVDDSADKRKKERRDLLREKRKERNYHNRRVE